MSLLTGRWTQFWLGIFGGCCAVAAFIGCILQARPGVACVNVISFGLNAYVAIDAWRWIHPRADVTRET